MAKRTRPATNRRAQQDRRTLLSDAANLATASQEVVTAHATGLTLLAALQRDIELVRTPTAPKVQRQVAIDRVLGQLEELRATLTRQSKLAQALGKDAQRLAAAVATEQTSSEDEQR